jgi:hypothetical protein
MIQEISVLSSTVQCGVIMFYSRPKKMNSLETLLVVNKQGMRIIHNACIAAFK